MRWLILLLSVTNPAGAQEMLSGAEITAALTARVLGFDDGTRQNFFADGRTLFEKDNPHWGHWRVEGDRYCSQWPPSDRWSCYSVMRDRLNIGFVAGDGSVSQGRYIDLQ